MSVKSDFITTSVNDVLLEGVAAADCLLHDGIDTYPVLEYLLQTVFLKMTGFEEQKLRNICWEVASIDLKYRYDTLQGRVSYGEFSSLDNKKDVFILLRNKIKEYGKDLDLETKKDGMMNEVKDEMKAIFDGSLIAKSFPAEYHRYEVFVKSWNKDHFAKDSQLLGGSLEEVYDALYKQRNRCAHNTSSYQQDALTLTEMQNKIMPNCNYLSYFALLLLLDKIFIETYNEFIVSYSVRV